MFLLQPINHCLEEANPLVLLLLDITGCNVEEEVSLVFMTNTTS